ncbi:hypothetical protein A1OW_20315 [Enterovibrio norvegicus]|uniref:hypothetical protein n=1 Tax=Enterovibrio norvegicus TaxID=188144 RepID=UPI0002F7E186|nr:hypothetical protein [Enterovibrio norvegicus]OEF61218.1 hypothetical protein A1OW_20315 [Enterovibrio norvegicus]
MKAQRLSQTQKDVLFVLALLEVNGKTGLIPAARVRDMATTTRPAPIDPSNFRKGVHTMASRGLIDVERGHNLSLFLRLSNVGRHTAAGIYRDRTGEQLDVKQSDDEQITIFDVS